MFTFLRDCRWGKFILIRGDLISQFVDMYGEWCETEVELFKFLLTPDSVCIEVGSNIGTHTVPISKICSRGMVFGFEPQNPIYKVLCGNLALNNCLNVRALNQAVGLTRSIIEIETCGYDENWNYGAFSISDGFNREGRFPGTAASEKVSIISLDGDDSISAMSRIDFLKIDAEGAEVAVLRGAQNMIDRHKPDIFVEANDKDVTNGSLKYLGKLGYVGFWFISNRFRVDNFNRNRFRIEGFDSNIIFRHPDRHGAGLNLPLAQDFSQISNGLPILNSFTR